MTKNTVGLPPERFIQLKRLAEAENVSISDVIAGFLDDAIDAKRLPDELPGWLIQRVGEKVVLTHADCGFLKVLPLSGAKSVGETLCRFGAPDARRAATLDLDHMIEFRRQGAGVILRDAASEAEYSSAPNVVADLGRRLVRAAA